MVSTFKLNLFKNKLGGIELNTTQIELYAVFFKKKSMKIPFTYLDVPIVGNPWKFTMWETVIQKVKE